MLCRNRVSIGGSAMRTHIIRFSASLYSATSLAVVCCTLVLTAAGDPAPGLETIRADALKGHIFFLASDAMAGRDSMTREGRIAADYIAGFFYRAGLKPVGDNNTFFQNFPMVEAHIDRERTKLVARITSKTGGTLDRDYANGPDFTMPRQGNVDVSVSAPLVFGGYGITAPEYDYDDFKGVDVAGKVIMILAHEPQETDPGSRFKGAWNTVHAYNWWKPEVARRHGAAAMLMVQDRVNRRPPRAISGPTNAQIRTDRGQHTLTSPFWDIPMFSITRRVADELLAGSGRTIDQLQDAIDRAGTPQSVAVSGVTVDLRRAIKDRQITQTRNVVGVVEGSDPVLKNEYVLVTGHYDHVGQKDQFIYHGADDNASACAAVIAMAEALTSTMERPKRSVMFVVFEAEEDGLLGAFEYVDHRIVPLPSAVA